MTYTTHSEADTMALAARLAPMLAPGDTVLLNGDLGAGKSVLARGIARGMGIKGPMPSPTFTLMQPYRGRIPFYHFDLYRLDDPEQFWEAGLDEFVGGDGAAVVEWPDRAELEGNMTIRLARCEDSDDARLIALTLSGPDQRRKDIEDTLAQWRLDA